MELARENGISLADLCAFCPGETMDESVTAFANRVSVTFDQRLGNHRDACSYGAIWLLGAVSQQLPDWVLSHAQKLAQQKCEG
jgi:hypothetical protein